ncbi:MAG TPA: cyclase family protein, partial [Acidimicrobiales bacterium]|nr:cyclase family protein [Acidimicrobiales bacterium]
MSDDGKPGNWGRWGNDDERGAVNLCTPARVLEAAQASRTGKVYGLALQLGRKTPPVFGRPEPQRLTVNSPADFADHERFGAPKGTGASDDMLILASHVGTHMDALAHVYAEDSIYNGYAAGTFTPRKGATRCSIVKTASFAGRGVLLDVAGHQGVPLCEPGRPITADDLEACRSAQEVEMRPGDILLVRTGWTEAHLRGEVAGDFQQPGLGLSAVDFVRDHDVSVVGADNSAVEVIPFDGNYLAVHVALLQRLGVSLMEHLWLAELAADRCHEFLLAVGALP